MISTGVQVHPPVRTDATSHEQGQSQRVDATVIYETRVIYLKRFQLFRTFCFALPWRPTGTANAIGPDDMTLRRWGY